MDYFRHVPPHNLRDLGPVSPNLSDAQIPLTRLLSKHFSTAVKLCLKKHLTDFLLFYTIVFTLISFKYYKNKQA